MKAVIKEAEMIAVNARVWEHPGVVEIQIDKSFVEDKYGKFVVRLSKKQATKFANVLRSQRNRLKR